MMTFRTGATGATAAFCAVLGTAALANCPVDTGRLSIIGNDFPAIRSVADAAMSCIEGDVSANLTADHQQINLAGMSGDPAEYTTALVANASIGALLNADVIRPLDDLIAEYGAGIPDLQKVSIDGQVMAIAYMANAQVLAYRADILEQIGADVPATYEEVLAVAETIRAEGILEYPIGGTYAAGWGLGQEFVNMYFGHGGTFFAPGSAELALDMDAATRALEMLKELSGYMNPDYLTADSNAATAEWEAGNTALMNIWGSRIGSLMDAEGAAPEVSENTGTAPPPSVAGTGTPASTLWWDGWTVARNISDADAAATFQAMAHATSPALLTDETMGQAVWLIDGYQPGAENEGVLAAAQGGTAPYPMLPYMGLLHTALGNNLADYMQGTETAQEALADVAAAYNAAARENGFLN